MNNRGKFLGTLDTWHSQRSNTFTYVSCNIGHIIRPQDIKSYHMAHMVWQNIGVM